MSLLKISLLVPTYKRPDLLERCLKSIKSAIFGNQQLFEVVVSDDSNLEANLVLFEKFKSDWQGTAYYHGRNQPLGQQRNFNFLIDQASGEWIQFVHDDDYLLPNIGDLLVEYSEFGQKNNFSVFKFGNILVSHHGKTLRREKPHANQYSNQQEAILKIARDSSYIRFPSIFARRNAYLKLNKFNVDLAYCADMALWFDFAANYGIYEISEFSVAYTVHDAAGTTLMYTPEYLDKIQAIVSRNLELITDRKVVSRINGFFIWKFALAGIIRAIKARDLAMYQQRVLLLGHLKNKGVRCPLKYAALNYAFKIASCLMPNVQKSTHHTR
jgi:glycosyltransferase involved in cell wall biosynthesis